MNNFTPLRIIVKGMHFSGSGTVTELLKEYEGYTQVPGGVIDLAPAGYFKLGEFRDYKLMRIGGIIADNLTEENYREIKIFVKNRLKSSIKKTLKLIKISNDFNFNSELVNNFIKIIKINKSLVKFAKSIEIDSTPEERKKIARIWISEVVKSVCGKAKYSALIFDQALEIDEHIPFWKEVFYPFKLIIVQRDPRDQIAEKILLGYWTKSWKQNLIDKYGSDILSYIKYDSENIKRQQIHVEQILNQFSTDEVLLLKFEDIILDYEKTKNRIELFLNINQKKHIYKKKYLKPEWSAKNIGIYRKLIQTIPEDILMPLMEWYSAH